MKGAALLLVFLLASSLPAAAGNGGRFQLGRPPAQYQGPPLGRVLRSLVLEPVQQRDVHRIMVQFENEQRGSNPPSRQELLRRIETVLSPAQRAKFRAQLGGNP